MPSGDDHTCEDYDYIIAGGGHAGCVLASRLSQALPNATVALIEAGPDAHENVLVQSPLGAPKLHGTELQWNYMTVPQRGLGGRPIYHSGGKLLSGGSAVNYGTWVRGHDADFDNWAALVGDRRWSYQGMLPYFKKTETHFNKEEDTSNPGEHGFSGPIHTMSATSFPLGPVIKDAYMEAGVQQIADTNSGQPLGLGRWVQNWRQGRRQPAGIAYDMSKVHIVKSTLVRRILLDKTGGKTKATGIVIDDGRQLTARKEIVVTCGALRTPLLLMHSGIGDERELRFHGIQTEVDLPEVGKNLHDHPAIMLYWNLKNPDKGLAAGHPKFGPTNEAPSEWIFTGSVPPEQISKALQADGVSSSGTNHSRAHYEVTVSYAGIAEPPDLKIPKDGSIITIGAACFLPTSRGTIGLSSADAASAPVLDPQYLTTEHDMVVMRHAIRTAMKVMGTSAAQAEIGEQAQPDGAKISEQSSDEELDKRIRPYAITWFHPGGTASMGKVVDSGLRVKGVEALRVCDASILPNPLGAHYQATIYALAEQAADIMAADA